MTSKLVRKVINWLVVVSIAIVLPAIFLLGYQAYRGIADQIAASSRLAQEIQIQELEHRIRSEQGRKCIIDELDALVKEESYLKPSECESPDLNDLLKALERAEERLLDE